MASERISVKLGFFIFLKAFLRCSRSTSASSRPRCGIVKTFWPHGDGSRVHEARAAAAALHPALRRVVPALSCASCSVGSGPVSRGSHHLLIREVRWHPRGSFSQAGHHPVGISKALVKSILQQQQQKSRALGAVSSGNGGREAVGQQTGPSGLLHRACRSSQLAKGPCPGEGTIPLRHPAEGRLPRGRV